MQKHVAIFSLLLIFFAITLASCTQVTLKNMPMENQKELSTLYFIRILSTKDQYQACFEVLFFPKKIFNMQKNESMILQNKSEVDKHSSYRISFYVDNIPKNICYNTNDVKIIREDIINKTKKNVSIDGLNLLIKITPCETNQEQVSTIIEFLSWIGEFPYSLKAESSMEINSWHFLGGTNL